MKSFLTLILVFLSFSIVIDTYSQNSGDKLYVWNYSGLLIRKNPNNLSEVKSKVPYGKKVSFLKSTNKTLIDTLNIFPCCKYEKQFFHTIKNNYVKIDYNGSIGYVFNGYLKSKPPGSIEEDKLNNFFMTSNYDLISNDTINKEMGEYGVAYEIESKFSNGVRKNWGDDGKVTTWKKIFIPFSLIELEELHLIIFNYINFMNKSYEVGYGKNQQFFSVSISDFDEPWGETYYFTLEKEGVTITYEFQGC